jgi:type I restriction enzyme S subunit
VNVQLNLPMGWSTTELGDVLLAVVGGGTPSRKVPSYFAGSIPWFTVKDMKVLKPHDAEEHITETAIAVSATNLVPANTLIVATRIALGRAIRPTVACAINQDLKALVVGPGIDPDLLLYWIGANDRVIQDLGSGTTVSGIRLEALHTLQLQLPPAIEQTRIVEKLEELLSDLDAAVAELKAAQKKLAQYRQSLLKAAVEGALTAEWRAERARCGEASESGAQLLARILTNRRTRWEARQRAKFKEQGKAPPQGWQDKYPEPVQPETADLAALPKGWVWASAEQLCEFVTKGTTPPKELKDTGPKVVPFLRVTNLTAHGTLELNDEVFVSEQTHRNFLARSTVYPGDVLMNIVGPPLGQVAVVPSLFAEWNINQAIAIFRAVEGVLPSFVCRLLLSPSLQRWLKTRAKTTAGQTNLTLEVCRSLPMPLPPQEEQLALVNLIDAAMGVTEEQASAIEQALKQSAAQRKNILKAAFSGQLVPQDPSDEPASVLLERIRAERAERDRQPKARKPRAAKEPA